jgi:hypothetical protein
VTVTITQQRFIDIARLAQSIDMPVTAREFEGQELELVDVSFFLMLSNSVLTACSNNLLIKCMQSMKACFDQKVRISDYNHFAADAMLAGWRAELGTICMAIHDFNFIR